MEHCSDGGRPVTVDQLVQILQTYPPGLRVVVNGYEDGYVGAEPQADDGVPFEDKMARLSAQWRKQQIEAQRLDAAIEENLKGLGFG